MSRKTLVAVPLAAVGGGLAAAGGLVAQAWYAVNLPLPTFGGTDISGADGPIGGPVVEIAALGDSSLTGPGLDHVGDVWLRAATCRLADEIGCRLVVRSYAVGGSRVGEALAAQLPELAAVGADIAVVAIGPNDVFRVTPVRQFRRDLRDLLRGMKAAAREVIVGGVADVGAIPRIPAPLRQVARWRSRTLDRVVRRVAAQEGVRFVDVAAANQAIAVAGRTAFCDDLFHCNAQGHAEWTKLAVPPLGEAVRQVLAGRAPAEAAAAGEAGDDARSG